MQHRHKTELTATEYVNKKAWRSATPPRCLKRCDSVRCGIQRHSAYRQPVNECAAHRYPLQQGKQLQSSALTESENYSNE